MPKPKKSKKEAVFWEYKPGFNHLLGYKEGKMPVHSKIILKEYATANRFADASDSLLAGQNNF